MQFKPKELDDPVVYVGVNLVGQPAPLDSPKGALSANWLVVDFQQKQ